MLKWGVKSSWLIVLAAGYETFAQLKIHLRLNRACMGVVTHGSTVIYKSSKIDLQSPAQQYWNYTFEAI